MRSNASSLTVFGLVYMGHIKDNWGRLFRLMRRYWGVIALLLFCLASFLPLVGLVSALEAIDAVADVAGTWPLEAYKYGSLAAHFQSRRWIYLAVVVTFTVLSFPIGLLLWNLTQTVVDVVFQLFYRIKPSYYRLNRKYSAFEYRKLSAILNTLAAIYIGLFGVVVALTLSKGRNTTVILDLLGFGAIIAVPVVWTVVWWIRFRILRRRPAPRLGHRYEAYLLSADGVVHSFTGVVGLLVWLALLGWVLLPQILGGVVSLPTRMASRLETSWAYSQTRDIVTRNTEFVAFLVGSNLWVPPAIEQLPASLNVFPGLYDPARNQVVGLDRFMAYSLIVVTLAGMLSVAVPTLYVARRAGGRRRAAGRVLVATFKTMAVSIFLQLMLEYTYFVDTSRILGLATIFMFMMTFFLTLEAEAQRRDVELGGETADRASQEEA